MSTADIYSLTVISCIYRTEMCKLNASYAKPGVPATSWASGFGLQWSDQPSPMPVYRGGNLKPGQAKKLASLQRQALMLTGHLRKGTPTTGLNVVLDSIPIDLYITGEMAKTRIRLRHRLPRDWNGCGPGPYGKFGHIRLSDFLIDQLNIPDLQTDDAVKSKNFDFTTRSTLAPWSMV